MGNSQFEGGSLQINFEKTFQTPGQPIIAEAVLTLQKPYPANEIEIVLKGQEKMKANSNGTIHDWSKDFYIQNSNINLGISSPIIEPGTYKVPLKLEFDSDLPSSMHAQHVYR